MPWVKMDDHIDESPKLLAVSAEARWLYICGLAYSGRRLTDGVIPAQMVRKLVEYDNAEELAASLVKAGLWEKRRGGGFLIHDWGDYNPPAAQVKAEREATKKRVREWRERTPDVTPPVTPDVTPDVTGDVTPSVTPLQTPFVTPPVTPNERRSYPVGNGVRTPSPYPYPEPVPEPIPEPRTKTLGVATKPRRRDVVFEAFCEATNVNLESIHEGRRSALNRYVRDIRATFPAVADFDGSTTWTPEAQAAEIHRRAANWPYDFPLTPESLWKRWAELDRAPAKRPRSTGDRLIAEGLREVRAERELP